MLAKDDRKAMLLRLFNDDSPLKDRSKDRLAARQDTSTSTPHSTTAELAQGGDQAGGLQVDEGGETIGEGGDNDEDDGIELDVGGGEGIMKIGGAD